MIATKYGRKRLTINTELNRNRKQIPKEADKDINTVSKVQKEYSRLLLMISTLPEVNKIEWKFVSN